MEAHWFLQSAIFAEQKEPKKKGSIFENIENIEIYTDLLDDLDFGEQKNADQDCWYNSSVDDPSGHQRTHAHWVNEPRPFIGISQTESARHIG